METLAISHDYVLSAFDYQDGNLIRKTGRVNEIGQVAGCIHKGTGYIHVKIKAKCFKAHRLVFLYHYGYLPECVDHIDGNRSNNKWTNLREATVFDNNRNMRLYCRNVTGLHGVHPSSRGGWNVNFPGKSTWAKDFFEACCIRKSAENRIGFHENHGRR